LTYSPSPTAGIIWQSSNAFISEDFPLYKKIIIKSLVHFDNPQKYRLPDPVIPIRQTFKSNELLLEFNLFLNISVSFRNSSARELLNIECSLIASLNESKQSIRYFWQYFDVIVEALERLESI